MGTENNQYLPPIAFHPGEILREKLEELGMGMKEFAVRSSKPEKTIHAIMNSTSSITPEMAVLFENVLKIPAHFWLNMQRSFDEFCARKEHEELLAESTEWALKFPIADMVRKGWLPAKSSITDKTQELLAYFSISNPKAWEDYYINQKLKVAFRISLAHTNEPHAISAWLRRGELQAALLPSNPYSEKNFKDVLPKIKNIMITHPDDYFKQLQETCLESGVKVVFTPCIKKAPLNGSTRWLNDTPLIQLTGRGNRNDTFWFTFFHEVGHILLHGKKDIFLENPEYSEQDQEKENAADIFAISHTFPEGNLMEMAQNGRFEMSDIKESAKKFNTHPALIVGRLQREKLIPFSFGKQFFVPLNLEQE